MEELYKIIEEKDRIINRQTKRISDLKNELILVTGERDQMLEKLTNLGIYRESSGEPNTVETRHRHSSDEARTTVVSASVITDSITSKLSTPSNTNKRVQRQRSFKSSDTDSIRRSRQSDEYELSEDIRETQIEMLEKKYGGTIRTRRAARTIQRAFRHYTLSKNFEKLRSNRGDRRVSKRLSELGRSSIQWNDRSSRQDIRGNMVHIESVGDSFNYGNNLKLGRYDTPRHLTSHHSLDVPLMQSRSSPKLQNMSANETQDSDRNSNSLGRLSSVKNNVTVDETNNNRNSCPEMNRTSERNDSSSSNSPRITPIDVDIHGIEYEMSLENREGDVFHSSNTYCNNSSNQSITPLGHTQPTFHRIPLHYVPSEVNGEHRQIYDNYPIYSNHMDVILPQTSSASSSYADRGVDNYHRGGPQHVSNHHRVSSTIDPQYQFYTTHPSSYNQSDVRLRRKNNSDPSLRSNLTPNSRTTDISPVWKRKNNVPTNNVPAKALESKRMSNISETSEADSADGQCYSSSPSSENVSSENTSLGSEQSIVYQSRLQLTPEQQPPRPMGDKMRKRLYRIGLNLFNKKPERGIYFLIENNFIEENPSAVARFLISRKGLSKQMIGEYLGNLSNPFNQEVIDCFCDDIDLSGHQVDVALRKFQSFFRMPGEAQKIERLVESFAQRYCICNPDQVKSFKTEDTIFLLAFAIIMLNTDLHNSSIKPERRMKCDDFIKNLRGIDNGSDLDSVMLTKLYERVRQQEFRPGADHVSQVLKVEQTIVGKKPVLALPHRRLVCYCRLYEIHDINKKEKIGLHQREVFLFNDLLLITKIFNKKKTGITYTFKTSFPLYGMHVHFFQNPHYQYGLRLSSGINGRVLIAFNARNDHDRQKFVEDLKDAILETNGMETIRIEEELSKHRSSTHKPNGHYINDDSRMMGYDITKGGDALVNNMSPKQLDSVVDGVKLFRLLSEGSYRKVKT